MAEAVRLGRAPNPGCNGDVAQARAVARDGLARGVT
jgi:hypothetical protein